MKLREIKDIVSADMIGRSADGTITCHWGFFYSNGKDPEHYVTRVMDRLPGAIVLDSGRVDKAFRGSATVAQSSHFWVKLRMKV